jgi:anti-sigma factor RsiW
MELCERSNEVNAYHDNALPEAKRIALEGHLQTCASCARELESLRRLSRLFAAGLNTPEPVRVKLRDLRESRSARRFEMGLIGMAASILIICGAWLMNVSPANGDDQLAGVTLDSVMSHSRSADIRDPLMQALVKEYARE